MFGTLYVLVLGRVQLGTEYSAAHQKSRDLAGEPKMAAPEGIT